MTATKDIHLHATHPPERSCTDCRFGAGYPQGPQGLMRCVNPGHPTVGQFLRGPVACEGFQPRDEPARKALTPAAPALAGCGDCEYADLFTVEPACACAHIALGGHQRVRSLDSPVCALFRQRLYPDLTLHASYLHAAHVA
jgi:hypothetical protein